MAISQKWVVNTKPLDDLAHFADSFEQIAFGVFDEVAQEIEPLLLDELRHYPPVPPGSTYIRTFRLQEGWHVFILQQAGSFIIRVSNEVEYSQWVVGSLAQAIAAAAAFQRVFHREHGWQLATETVTFWFEAFMEAFEQRFADELGQFGTFTSRRRARTRL